MKFYEYSRTRDQDLFFEDAGFKKEDVVGAAKAMQEWVAATEKLVAALDQVPVAYGELGGGAASPKVSADVSEQQIALEVQRARYVVQEANLPDLLDRLNQYSARISTALENLHEWGGVTAGGMRPTDLSGHWASHNWNQLDKANASYWARKAAEKEEEEKKATERKAAMKKK